MKKNPITKAEAYEQLQEIYPLFANTPYDEGKDCFKLVTNFVDKSRLGSYMTDKFELKYFGHDDMCMLSKEDYQAVCAVKTFDHTQDLLFSLCVDGKKNEVDKLVPGFYDKYSKHILGLKNGVKFLLETNDEILQQAQKDIADNFTKIHPDFYKETQEKYNSLRKESGCSTTMEISDSQFYSFFGLYVYMCDENSETGQKLSDFRGFYNSLVEQSKKQSTKKRMKSDSKKYQQKIQNLEDNSEAKETNTKEQDNTSVFSLSSLKNKLMR